MKEIKVQAIPDNLHLVLDFIDSELEASNCPTKKKMQIAIVVEEIFINVAYYAYFPDTGTVLVRCQVENNPPQITIQFIDSGKPFNPLDKKDPDITLTAEERDIGGLGLYMVKKSVDCVNYEYQNEKNILTIKKFL